MRQTGWHAGCISDAMPRVSVNVRARQIVSNLLLGSAVMLLFQLRVIAGQPGPTGSPTGQSVTLGWDPNNDPDVAGYKIYYGTASQTYTNVVVVGNTNNGTITGLVAGTTYYFAATEYNLTGAESAFSDEVSYNDASRQMHFSGRPIIKKAKSLFLADNIWLNIDDKSINMKDNVWARFYYNDFQRTSMEVKVETDKNAASGKTLQ